MNIQMERKINQCEACKEPCGYYEYCQECCREQLQHVKDDDHECTACGVSFAEEYADCYDEGER